MSKREEFLDKFLDLCSEYNVNILLNAESRDYRFSHANLEIVGDGFSIDISTLKCLEVDWHKFEYSTKQINIIQYLQEKLENKEYDSTTF